MEERHGINYVTSIGTYGTFKIKSGIKDITRALNKDAKVANYTTSILDDDLSVTDLFRVANTTPVIKDFLQKNLDVIDNYLLLKDQVKTASVHAAGVIIVPKIYNNRPMTIYDWMPVKKVDNILVTEWEGPVLEASGFLKEDILGTKQLQKLFEITELIKKNHNEQIDFSNIPLDDQEVYNLFQGGNNEDVFQFGAVGLKGYCRELKPQVIDDLIATVALYRPGPMESGIHKSYIKVKNGERDCEYNFMMEDITKNTHGLIIYQEQVMEVMRVLGGFNLVEADDVRKALGKKDMEKMEKYKIQFLESVIEKGCDKFKAISIWNEMEAFALYSFNKSHAAAYAHTGYYCQYLKQHFPLEFWSVALNFSDQEEMARRIAEMHKISEVKVLPPDINKSTSVFEADQETKEIFWAIGSIKFIGDKALNAIINEREKNGKYFSFDEFYSRVERRLVNKRCVTNLIVAGCFDKIEKITSPRDRINLLRRFLCDICGDRLPDDVSDTSNNWKDYFWILKQKELTGFGYIQFDKVYNSYIFPELEYKNKSQLKYINEEVFQDKQSEGDHKCVVGILSEVMERKMRNKPGSFAEIILNCNDENISCLIWSEIWPDFKEVISKSKNKIIAITGKILYDDKYKHKNVLQTTDSTVIEIL